MKVLRFKFNKPEWSVPLDEVSKDIRRMLWIQWREFIHELEDLEEPYIVSDADPALIARLERLFA